MKNYIIIFTILYSAVLLANQPKISDLKLLVRCYAHLTQRKIPKTHTLFQKVKNGEKTGIQACMEVLDYAKLNPFTGELINKSHESRYVLETFITFHKEQLSAKTFWDSLIFSQQYYAQFIHEETAGALYMTRALLGNLNYSYVFTKERPIQTKRISPLTYGEAHGFLPSYVAQSPNSSDRSLFVPPFSLDNEPYMIYGELDGIMDMKDLKYNKHYYLVESDLIQYAYRNHGGGVLGNPTYLLMNIGKTHDQKSDGGLSMNRRWSKNVIKDFLCRDLPVLPQSLVQTQDDVTSQTPPFRTNRSCMACHQTMDSMAGLIRNHVVVGAGYSNMGQNDNVQIFKYPVSKGPNNIPWIDKDDEYHLRPPTGSMHFVNYKGEERLISATNLQDFGSKLLQEEDVYVCTAKKYVEYFTGVSVDLNPFNTEISEADQVYKDFVIGLGLSLKQNKSLRTLVDNIFKSNLYQSPSYLIIKTEGE